MGVYPGRGVSHTPSKRPNGGECRYIHSALVARKRGRMRYAPTLPSDRSLRHACAPVGDHFESRRRGGAHVGYSDNSPLRKIPPAGNHLMSRLRPVALTVVSNKSALRSDAPVGHSNGASFCSDTPVGHSNGASFCSDALVGHFNEASFCSDTPIRTFSRSFRLPTAPSRFSVVRSYRPTFVPS